MNYSIPIANSYLIHFVDTIKKIKFRVELKITMSELIKNRNDIKNLIQINLQMILISICLSDFLCEYLNQRIKFIEWDKYQCHLLIIKKVYQIFFFINLYIPLMIDTIYLS